RRGAWSRAYRRPSFSRMISSASPSSATRSGRPLARASTASRIAWVSRHAPRSGPTVSMSSSMARLASSALVTETPPVWCSCRSSPPFGCPPRATWRRRLSRGLVGGLCPPLWNLDNLQDVVRLGGIPSQGSTVECPYIGTPDILVFHEKPTEERTESHHPLIAPTHTYPVRLRTA